MTTRETKGVGVNPGSAAQPASSNGRAPSNHDVLRRLYASMLRCRMLSEQAQRLAGDTNPGAHWDFTTGSEAIISGSTLELKRTDTLVASPRDFQARVVKRPRYSPITRGKGSRFSVGAAAAAGSTSVHPFHLGTGIALAHRLGKTRNVVIALCGENTSSSDGWHEAMKFAGAHRLPIIYVLRSSSAFETSMAAKTPALDEISFMARNGGFPAVIVDGNDAVAVWRVTHESVHRARNGGGPTLIECEKRFTQYEDPLAHIEHYMKKRGLWDDQWSRETMEGIEAEIRAASQHSPDLP